MEKGIIFTGCSFTWGQGLWMYYDKDIKIPMSIEYTGGLDNMDKEWKSIRVPEEAYELHKTLGWPTKVAEYLNGTPIIKRYNGGNDDESIRFIDEVFGNNDVSVNEHSIVKKNYDIENVDYIFFKQLNHIDVILNLNIITKIIKCGQHQTYRILKEYLKWYLLKVMVFKKNNILKK